MKKIFIDTDCGIDDAVAIMLGLSSPEVDLVGISCVAGNTSLDNVIANVCGLLSFYEREDIPVYKGCSTSLLRIKHSASAIHGKNGLANVVLDAKTKTVEKENAAEGLYLAAKANPGLTLVTLGPLGNIAVAFNLYPELKKLVSEIVIMGGAIGPGNVTPFAEFNFYFDPEAVAFVLGIGLPIRILSWDATVEGMMPENEFLALGLCGTPAGDLFNKMQGFYIESIEKLTGRRTVGFPDPFTLACVIDPSIATVTEKMNLKMVLPKHDKKRGATIKMDKPEIADGEASVIMKCDTAKFSALLQRIKEKSPSKGEIGSLDE